LPERDHGKGSLLFEKYLMGYYGANLGTLGENPQKSQIRVIMRRRREEKRRRDPEEGERHRKKCRSEKPDSIMPYFVARGKGNQRSVRIHTTCDDFKWRSAYLFDAARCKALRKGTHQDKHANANGRQEKEKGGALETRARWGVM